MKKLINTITNWRYWHHHVKYIPLSPVWIWYFLRSGNPWFFTASNPTLTFGGFEGEGKEEMYLQLPDGTYPETIYIEPDASFADVKEQVLQNGFGFPFIVKPDVGMMGFMFRKINNEKQLESYHKYIGVKYLVQKLVEYPIEVSLFYYRMPDASTGTISGFIQKEPPYITGDGKSTIADLIKNHHNPLLKKKQLLEKFSVSGQVVLPVAEKIYLSNASNRSQGGSFKDLLEGVDEKLLAFFDQVSHKGNFYYGRYDILCNSVADLKAGKNFSILEFNGAGAGTQQIYTDRYNFLKAESVILHHWKKLFQISRSNRKKGEKQWGVREGLRHLKESKKHLMDLLKKDEEFPVF